MSERKPLGDHCDALGVKVGLDDDDMVTDIYAIVKILEPNGETRLAFAWSDGISWIERLGMLTVAQAVETPAGRNTWQTGSDSDGA